tara:strand:+ start:372 stop:686 length:315 start_codon:yes stop_codon:yes gene_type:complete
MSSTKLTSNSAFKYAILTIAFIIVFIFADLVLDVEDAGLKSIILGFLILAGTFIAVIGLVKSIIGIREPNSIKKITALIINSVITILLGLLLLSTSIEVLKYLM